MTKRLFAPVAALLLVLVASTVVLAQDLNTRYGKISIVAYDRNGNLIMDDGTKTNYKRIQYLLNDKLIHEEVDESVAKPVPELVRVFQQSQSDAVLVLTDTGETTGTGAIRFIDVTDAGAKLSNVFADCKGEPRYSRKGDVIRVFFKEAKPLKVATYSNGYIR
ncbi:hypothetical protein [Geomonas anaerohicana]|uniref:Uncharacterized protein n=1 Tax=Geomonas anaerohicana TaxID=2798583 RepID=A0ABS0YFU1_9BACT|nr:hypothetical protein [Geomonas anaerohicana]MBJ6751175.1 hypothetical protein [Geomonas anaerohicana]